MYLDSGTISNPTYATDGSLTSYASNNTGTTTSLIIDLGALYPVDYIKVWHYFNDSRRYKNNTLSVGPTLTSGNTPLETVLWQYSGEAYVETSAGRKSKWLQENSI